MNKASRVLSVMLCAVLVFLAMPTVESEAAIWGLNGGNVEVQTGRANGTINSYPSQTYYPENLTHYHINAKLTTALWNNMSEGLWLTFKFEKVTSTTNLQIGISGADGTKYQTMTVAQGTRCTVKVFVPASQLRNGNTWVQINDYTGHNIIVYLTKP